ncbi:MAG: ATP-binding cassette domain-containing protein [Candidatus Latescibacterota bacterium]|nr:ATP-binding cassette domain-containing protein [Candidatus Latescibacterota bacterium]
MENAIELEGVEKRFGAKVAVDGLSLEVPRGCIYGFLGPNGAGKTTTLRMIIGIFHPDAGRVSVLGQSDPASVKERIGYLPEERGLYEKMRVRDLMTYFGQLKGMEAGLARKRASELLQRYGLGESADKKCQALSKGMAQKAQILATLIHEPELIILDEPFSGLDPLNRDLMRDLILQLKREGRSVIFSTHIMEQAEQICDRVLLIDDGRKILDGELSAVRSSAGEEIRLDYDGDGDFLHDLPGVARVNDSGKQAELFMEEDADPQAVLAALVAARVRVRRFDLRELSLHEIFIRAVGGGEKAVGGDTDGVGGDEDDE